VDLGEAVDVHRVGQPPAVRRQREVLHLPARPGSRIDDGPQLERPPVEAGQDHGVGVAVGQQEDPGAVGLHGRALEARVSRVRREQARLAIRDGQLDEVVVERAPRQAQQQVPPVGRPARRVAEPIRLVDEPRLARVDLLHVHVEAALVAAVGREGDPRRIRRPPAEHVHGSGLTGQRPRRLAVAADQPELDLLVAAHVGADDHRLAGRRAVHRADALLGERELLRPFARTAHREDLGDTEPVAHEGDAPVAEKARAVRAAHVDEARVVEPRCGVGHSRASA
jgi:hypothetical protein